MKPWIMHNFKPFKSLEQLTVKKGVYKDWFNFQSASQPLVAVGSSLTFSPEGYVHFSHAIILALSKERKEGITDS